MKVKFAIEKGMYSNLLQELTSGKEDVNTAVILIKMKIIEKIIAAYDDQIITIVSTRDTYDGPVTTEPIKAWDEMKIEPVYEETPVILTKEYVESDGDIYDGPVKETTTKEYVDNEIDIFKPLPSPKCDKCKHRMISHNRKGCRFCDCEEKRKKR